MSGRSVSSRSSSSSSVSSHSSHSSGKSSTRSYKERRLPDTPAVNTLLYFTGRHPKKVKGVRVYQTTWDDGFDDRSEHSSWSASSWGSHKPKTEIYLLESRGSYWDGGYSVKSSSSSGRNSRASRKGGNGDPWGKGGRGRHARVDDDSGSDNDGPPHGFPRPGGGPPMMGRPPPPMHHFPPPPPGAFQPGFGPPPQGFPGPPPPGHPGFQPRATPMPGPPPPPPQQGFTRDPNGVQVFMG